MKHIIKEKRKYLHCNIVTDDEAEDFKDICEALGCSQTLKLRGWILDLIRANKSILQRFREERNTRK